MRANTLSFDVDEDEEDDNDTGEFLLPKLCDTLL